MKRNARRSEPRHLLAATALVFLGFFPSPASSELLQGSGAQCIQSSEQPVVYTSNSGLLVRGAPERFAPDPVNLSLRSEDGVFFITDARGSAFCIVASTGHEGDTVAIVMAMMVVWTQPSGESRRRSATYRNLMSLVLDALPDSCVLSGVCSQRDLRRAARLFEVLSFERGGFSDFVEYRAFFSEGVLLGVVEEAVVDGQVRSLRDILE